MQKKTKKWGMVIDQRKCVGCHTCTVACKSENNVPLGYWRSWVKGIQKGAYPDVKNFFLRRLCNHCDDPPCVDVCPVQATVKRDDGVVTVYYGKCIGCGMCIAACPYDARFFNPIRRTADKCNFCTQRIDANRLPACVISCIGRAITFGDLNYRGSEVSKLLAANAAVVIKPELGTLPKVFYIAADKDIMGRIKISEDYPEAIEEYGKTIPSKLSDYWKK